MSRSGHWLSLWRRHQSLMTVPLLFTRIKGTHPGGWLESHVLNVTNCPFGKVSRSVYTASVALLNAEEQKEAKNRIHLLK